MATLQHRHAALSGLGLVLAGACIHLGLGAAPGHAATRYDGDGEHSGPLEEQRWLINRARHGPEAEADRLGLTNPVDHGYDACEDMDGANDFGSGPQAWAAWVTPRGPLAPNALLSVSARKHSRDMADTGAFQHPSPSGTYYEPGTQPWERHTEEGYVNFVSGYLENLAWAGRGTTGWYPSFGGTSAQFHEDLFVDEGVVVKGHRQAMLNPHARELGLGWERVQVWEDGTYWTRDYTTQDYGRRPGVHFFTGTLFHDADEDGRYDDGEGVPRVEVRLFDGEEEAPRYDESTPAGSFAVPLAELPPGRLLEVRLANPSATPRRLSLPFGLTTLGECVLGPGETRVVGTFRRPATDTNIGFRDLWPHLDLRLDGTTGAPRITYPTFAGVDYVVEEMIDGRWSEVRRMTAATERGRYRDEGAVRDRLLRVRMVVD